MKLNAYFNNSLISYIIPYLEDAPERTSEWDSVLSFNFTYITISEKKSDSFKFKTMLLIIINLTLLIQKMTVRLPKCSDYV